MAEATYLEMANRGSAPCGVTIFCDIERMSSGQWAIACRLWRKLSGSPKTHRLLNDPHRQLGRYPLLKALYEDGINRFNVFLPDEGLGALRYPVFLRIEDDHEGPRTDLLYDRAALDSAIDAMLLAGTPESRILVVEFLDTSEDGVFRKYGAYRVGDRIFGQHKILGTKWQLKSGDRIRSQAAMDENSEYWHLNPHADLLMPLFERAAIDYGRIDYAFLDGSLQVWEINDNPSFASSAPLRLSKEPKEVRYVESLDALGDGLVAGPSIEFDLFEESLIASLAVSGSAEEGGRKA